MKAAQVLQFGPPSVIINVDLPRPEPAAGQLLVRVKAAGVGNWDALVREGKLPNEHLPLILGYELAGSSKQLGVRFRVSSLAMKCTGQRTINSLEHTQNMHCRRPE
jgi:NADPH:quinone reductase-like Zn-dependent oxidoreductase